MTNHESRLIISANQPYFAPYPGFFYKAYLSDIFVILDAVQFPRGSTWLTRNRFKNDKGHLWIKVPVWKKGLGLQRIDRVKICHEFFFPEKLLMSLKTAYAMAPFFMDHFPFLSETLSKRFDRLVDLNMEIIRYLMRTLHIDTRVVLLSELDMEASGDRLLVEICRRLGGDGFLAQNSARKYLGEEAFHTAGIPLRFFKTPSLTYPQLWGGFIPNLSAFDLVFTCGPKARDFLTGK